jgi:hypothetical protein
MYWWHGVIVDDAFWAGCKDSDVSNENSKLHFAKSLGDRKKGWGKRYKVAIVGRHYAVKGSSSEADWLEMTEVVYPVTAGTGLGGSKQTSALRQGAHVIGFYADGKEGRNPVILGAFGVNEQNEPDIFGGDPQEFFKLRSGNKGICGEKLKPISEKDQNLESDKKPIESIESPLQASQSHKTKVEDGNISEEVKPTFGCESPSGIIGQIKSLLNKLSNIINLAKQGLTDLTSNLQSIIQSITSQITGLANGLIDRMRGYIVNKINDGIKDVMNMLPPFLRPDFNLKTQGALAGLACAFNNVKNAILDVVKNLIKQFIDNYVNAPLCAATSFLGSLLGNVIGQVNSGINTAVGIINSILNIGSGFANKALDIIDIALDLLKLFECDKDSPECPGTVKWSFWRGPNEIAVSVSEGASRLVSNILTEVETALPGSAKGASSNPCNSRQVPCGPPKVQITGGGGSGSLANPVVSVTGKILGLDFSTFGSGFTSSPQINLVDSCGTGGGAVFQPIMQPTGTFNEFQEEILKITGAVVLDSGTQYLPAPNGTTGGNGLIFSQPSDTILFKTGSTQVINGKEVNGTGYDVYEYGTTFQVKSGDEVYLPSGTFVEVYDSNNEVVQQLSGLGNLTKIDIQFSGTLTAPFNPDNVPTIPQIEYPLSGTSTVVTTLPSGEQITVPSTVVTTLPSGEQITVPSTVVTTLPSGEQITVPSIPSTVPLINELSYPVVAEIESVFIKNPGFGYTGEDTIAIQNNKGAELEFRVNGVGEVTEVIVANGGIGFADVPFIAINSPTGYNFEAVAVFKFRPLGEIDINNITIPSLGAKIVSVIDCVGKILPKQEFDRVE